MNGGTSFLHPDFGGNGAYGIPWITVPGSQPRVPMRSSTTTRATPAPTHSRRRAHRGRSGLQGDRHVLVLDRDNCRLYETFSAWPGARLDRLVRRGVRPALERPAARGWTSADGAGLPVLPGLIRRDEVLGGRIATPCASPWPHAARLRAPGHAPRQQPTDPNLPPMGLRVRLKADYRHRAVPPAVRVILTAMKEYGMLLADNGGDWFISGEINPGWNDEELRQLNTVPASAFEVVKHAPIQR